MSDEARLAELRSYVESGLYPKHWKPAIAFLLRLLDESRAAITGDSMPSKMVRLAAAKDAEIAALTEQLDRAMKVVEAARILLRDETGWDNLADALIALDAGAAAEKGT